MSDQHETEILHGTGELGKSRSQKKRESTALQGLGEELAALAPSILQDFGLPEELAEALDDWRDTKKPEARRRQMQYVGRLMREIDEEAVENIEARLEALNLKRRQDAGQFHQLEELREGLLTEESFERTLEEIRTLFPQVQEKQLRHLTLTARAEKKNNKPAKGYRELFRYLRALAEQQVTTEQQAE